MCYGTENECAKVCTILRMEKKSNLLFCLGMNFNFVARTIYIPFQMSQSIQYPIKVWKTIHKTGTRSFSHSIKCLFHFLCPFSLSLSQSVSHSHFYSPSLSFKPIFNLLISLHHPYETNKLYSSCILSPPSLTLV